MESQTQTTNTVTTTTTAEEVPVVPVVDGEPVVEAVTEEVAAADAPPASSLLTPAVGVLGVLLLGLVVLAVRRLFSK